MCGKWKILQMEIAVNRNTERLNFDKRQIERMRNVRNVFENRTTAFAKGADFCLRLLSFDSIYRIVRSVAVRQDGNKGKSNTP